MQNDPEYELKTSPIFNQLLDILDEYFLFGHMTLMLVGGTT